MRSGSRGVRPAWPVMGTRPMRKYRKAGCEGIQVVDKVLSRRWLVARGAVTEEEACQLPAVGPTLGFMNVRGTQS